MCIQPTVKLPDPKKIKSKAEKLITSIARRHLVFNIIRSQTDKKTIIITITTE